MEAMAIIVAFLALVTAVVNLTSALLNARKKKDHRSGKR